MDIGTLGDNSVIRIKLGFLLAMILGVMSIVSMFIIMRQDVLNTLNRLESLEKMRLTDTTALMELRLKVNSIDDNLYFFRKQYDEDRKK